MKIDRLLGIIIYLLNHKRTSASFLAKHFEVSTRTIMRDVDTLCLAGIPIKSTFGIDGGYEIMDTFKMSNQIVNQTDYSFIISALEGLASAYSNKDIDDTLDKMKLVTNSNSSSLILDIGVAKENAKINELLFVLNKMINSKQTIEILYTNANDDEKTYIVEPITTMYKWYNWYLLCYYPKYDDYRIFKLVRMNSIKSTGKLIGREHDCEKAKRCFEHSQDKRRMINIKLHCKSCIRSKCMEYLNGTVLKEYDNKDFEYQITVPENEQFWYGTLLSFGDNVTIIEPKELINRIIDSCNKIISKY